MFDALWKKENYEVADKTVPNTIENAPSLSDLFFSQNTSFGELADF
mgnify:FL=1|jgi:hypothetical protein